MMLLRFYRSFRAAPLQLNVNIRNKSTSIGGRGSWLADGRNGARAIVGLSGNGLYWTKQRGLPTSAIAAPNLRRDGMLSRLPWTISALAFAGVVIIFAMVLQR
jgi:Protein of unknown function (DUF4236)